MNTAHTPLVVPLSPNDNTTDLLSQRAALTPEQPIFAIPEGERWRDVTAAEFQSQVIALAKGLVAAGIQPGDKIAFACRTTYQWSLVDFAIWYSGAIMVPIYETSSPSQFHWIIQDSGATSVILETAEHFAKFDEVHPELPNISQVWQLSSGDLDKLAAAGTDVPDEEIERRRNLARGEDMATLIYTSGSTGRPRGCVLTHSNFVELARNSAHQLSEVVTPGASTLLFVTLAHVFARFISVLCVHAGVKVGHQPDTTKLLPSMGSFHPSFLLAVPRVFEKVYNSAEQKAETGGKGKIFRLAARTAVEYSQAGQAGGAIPLGLKLKFAILDKLVLSKLKEALGGRVRFAVSGSAPLGDFLGHFYHSLGIKILEGYGLTETTAPVSVNLPGNFKIGTVGPPLPGHTVKIAGDGEVLVQGIDVFKEYWQNPEATSAAFDEEGFFRTGDLGQLDSDGYLTITGRKKEIIVTAGGKNVSPAALEDPIRANPVISQVVVVGDRRPFITALVTLDQEMLPVWLNNQGEDAGMSVVEASRHPLVLAEIQAAVDRANERVSRAESIRKFAVLPVDFTEPNGHLTPKMSIRRANILRDFAHEVEGMYNNNPPATEGVSVTGG